MQSWSNKQLIVPWHKKIQVITKKKIISFNDKDDDNLSFYYCNIELSHLQIYLSEFFIIQINWGLKNTYVLSNYAYYSHNISNF